VPHVEQDDQCTGNEFCLSSIELTFWNKAILI
jgi:hypothetical protein